MGYEKNLSVVGYLTKFRLRIFGFWLNPAAEEPQRVLRFLAILLEA